MLIERIKLKNVLSFGPEGIDLQLRNLNLLIGPNGSGKSNLIEAIGLLKALPRDLTLPIREGGGIRDWIWRGKTSNLATIETLIKDETTRRRLRHHLVFGEYAEQSAVFAERIEKSTGASTSARFVLNYERKNGSRKYHPGTPGASSRANVLDPQQSILAQRRGPERYSEITRLSECYRRIRMYKDWTFGRNNPIRDSQKTDLRNDHLSAKCENLALVLSRFKKHPQLKRQIIELMRKFINDVTDFEVLVEGGRAQLFLLEGDFSVPATWLSDGTLRYLCLLAILLDPEPPFLVCIEEPELGLHPDCIVTVGDLLIEASKRQSPRPIQLIVTTHSEILVDAMKDRVEDVVVCERHENGTTMQRLKKSKLKPWLKDYSLGQLWSRGEIGGNRW